MMMWEVDNIGHIRKRRGATFVQTKISGTGEESIILQESGAANEKKEDMLRSKRKKY